MADISSGDDNFGDFCDEGLLIDSFTPSESITNDLSSDTRIITILHFGDCLKRIVDYNMILTLPMELRAQQDQVSKAENELWEIITKKPAAIELKDENSKQVEPGVVMDETPGKLTFNKLSKGMT